MAILRSLIKPLIALLLLLPLASTTACGGSGSEAQHAQVKPGNMPVGGEWTGVFYSPLYGYLHLVKEGDSISGKWRTTAGDKWGEMHGKVTGDLFRYEWVEHKIGMVGPSATTKGRGYFRYIVPPGENVEHQIKGEWGLGTSDMGQTWEAIRQRNMQPDPDSVMPDEHQRLETESWDAPNKQPKGVEPDKSDDSDDSNGDDEGGGEEW